MGACLSLPQIAAVATVHKLGKALAEEHPEIADFYQQGSTALQLAYQYLPEHTERSESVARNAVRYALQQLLTPEELRTLAKEHLQENGSKNGTATFQAKTGIHAQTLEGRLEAARKAYPCGLGRCSETVLAYGRLQGLLAMGKFPYSDEEKEALLQLAQDPAYQYHSGWWKGKPAYELISIELSQRFGVRRTASALKTMYYRLVEQGNRK